MKKLIGLLLAVCLALPSAAAAETFSDTENSGFETAVSFVSALGFMEGYPDGTFHVNDTMTRAEFATLAVRLMGLEAGETEQDTQFPDVGSGHWASAAVTAAVSAGLMTGYSDGYFYPEQPVTMAEAVRGMIGVLGYTFYAENQGGFPQGYLAQAASLGILRGAANGSAAATRGSVAQLVWESADVEILRQVSYGAKPELKKEKNVTFLSEYHDIYRQRGIVTANQFTKINGDTTLEKGEVEIESVVYDAGASGAEAYLAQSVEFFVREDHSADRDTILFLHPRSNRIVEVKSADLSAESTAGRLVYFDGGRKQTENIDLSADIIYNQGYDGKAINLDPATLAQVHGTLRGVDNDNDGGIDVLFLTDWRTAVVDSVSKTDSRISMMYGAQALELDGSNIRCSIQKDGREITLAELQQKDLLSIAASRQFYEEGASGKKAVQIIVCSDILSGEAVEVSEEGVVLRTTANKETKEERYRVSSQFVSENGTQVRNDFKGAFYLDAAGEIAYFVQGGSSSKKFGYILDAASDGGMSTDYSVKLLSQTGEVTIYQLADRVVVDGNGSSAAQAYRVMAAGTDLEGKVRLMVRYQLNTEGKINFIDTKAPNSDQDVDELTETKIELTGGMRYQSEAHMLVSYNAPQRFVIGDNAIVFVIPEQAESDDEYMIYGSSYFQNEQYYGNPASGELFSMYNVKDGIPAAISMTVKAATAGKGNIDTSSAPVGIVTKISKAATESGDTQTNITMMLSGKEKKVAYVEKSKIVRYNSSHSITDQRPDGTGKMTAQDLKFGDLVMVDADAQGRVNVLFRVCDFSPAELSKNGDPKYQVLNMSGYEEWIFGSVRSKKEKSLAIDVNLGIDLRVNALKTPAVCVIDSESKIVTVSELGSVQASEDDANADKVFVRVRFGNVKEIFMYR